jgi:hypothetical protein
MLETHGAFSPQKLLTRIGIYFQNSHFTDSVNKLNTKHRRQRRRCFVSVQGSTLESYPRASGS